MAFTIEMTLRGILLAGKWRTEEDLNHTSTENKRNTLIVEMAHHTNQDGGIFQAMSDEELIGVGAVVVFLREAEIRDDDALRKMSYDDQRNIMIIEDNNRTDRPIGELQGLKNQELVQIGLDWFAKSRTIAAILEMYWNVDLAKVLNAVPDIIETQTYDNQDSAQQLKSSFTVSKEIRNTSTFSHEHGFTVAIGVETLFKAGIPFLAQNKTSVKIDTSTTNTWKFGEENTTVQTYSHSSDVEVPPHKRLQLIAQVTKGKLDVPYRAKIRAGDGSIKWIEGTWNGVSTANLIVKQSDITE